jgi:anti-sigma factor RsiW
VNCTDFLAKLTDYFDGQIDPDLLAEVKAQHLGTCHHCEVVVDTTRKTIDVYRGNQTYDFPRSWPSACAPPSWNAAVQPALPEVELKPGGKMPSPQEFIREETAITSAQH